MAQDFLSDIELYYTTSDLVNENYLTITDDECKHIVRVMRHKPGDELFVTDGIGNIFRTEIRDVCKSEVNCKILEKRVYHKEFENIIFCIPRLKSQDRFDFAIEKCIELGITEFIIYTADRSVSKGEKISRWNKIALSAMKQSLRAFLPTIKYCASLQEISNSTEKIIYFDQHSTTELKSSVDQLREEKPTALVFGPEGGISDKEFEILKNAQNYKLTSNRLRAETAIITAAGLITI